MFLEFGDSEKNLKIYVMYRRSDDRLPYYDRFNDILHSLCLGAGRQRKSIGDFFCTCSLF